MIGSRPPLPFARQQYRQVRRRFLARNVWVLVALLLGTGGTLALQALWVHGYVLGLIHGGFLVAMVAMLRSQFWAHTGAFSLLLGGQGEDDTRAQLRRAARSGKIFGSIDGIELERCDIDHLVATPAGWYAIDTKWRSKPMTVTDIDRDASSAKYAARKARSVLRAHGIVAEVRAAVVVWGGAAAAMPANGYRHSSGVDFIPGRYLVNWLSEQPEHQPLTQPQANELLDKLNTFRRRHVLINSAR